MFKFESRFKELAFYVEGKKYKFANGVFNTEDKKVAEVLKALADVVLVEEPAEEKPKPKASAK
jgi:hypothetical protein